MKKTNNIFTVNFFEMTITGTQASFNKAGKGTGEAYEELTRLMKAHPEFVLVKKEQKKHINRAKRDYNGMDFNFMEKYIKYILNNDEAIVNQYKAVKAFAKKEKISVYPFTKRWFINEFGDDDKESKVEGKKFFDMAKAEKVIKEAEQEEAKKAA